jgi:hypothetical protein
MTLTEAAYWTKRVGIIFLAGGTLIIVGIMIWFKLSNPDPLPEFLKADYGCTITAEEFKPHSLDIATKQLGVGSEKIYSIDTATGRLEELPSIAFVYKYNNPGPSLNSQNDAKDLARNLGLLPEDIILRGGLSYEWAEDSLGRSLSVNVSTMNFDFRTNFANPNSYPSEGNILPSDQEAVIRASSYLRSNGLMLEDYAEEEPGVTYINLLPNGTYTMAKSRAEAELIRIDFFRAIPFLSVREDIAGAKEIIASLEKEYNEYPTSTESVLGAGGKLDIYNFNSQIVHLDSQKGNLTVYIGPEDKRRDETTFADVYEVNYTGWVIDREPCGTYDLISATEVTTIIENGNASLIYLNETNGDYVVPYTPKVVKQFTVNNVYLGYLDTLEEQTYLQPVYIVIGEASLSNGIVGQFYYYVPAINYNVIQDKKFIEEVVIEDSSSFL